MSKDYRPIIVDKIFLKALWSLQRAFFVPSYNNLSQQVFHENPAPLMNILFMGNLDEGDAILFGEGFQEKPITLLCQCKECNLAFSSQKLHSSFSLKQIKIQVIIQSKVRVKINDLN